MLIVAKFIIEFEILRMHAYVPSKYTSNCTQVAVATSALINITNKSNSNFNVDAHSLNSYQQRKYSSHLLHLKEIIISKTKIITHSLPLLLALYIIFF